MLVEYKPIGGAVIPPSGASSHALIVHDPQSHEKCAVLIDFGLEPRPLKAAKGKYYSSTPPSEKPQVKNFGYGLHVRKLPSLEDFLGIGDKVVYASEECLPACKLLEGIRVLCVVATHAHFDHIGGIPWFHVKFPDTKIVMTEPTLEMGERLWMAYTRSLQLRNIRPLYHESDIECLQDKAWLVRAGESIDIGPFSLKFLEANHVLGALCVFVTINTPRGSGIKIFFSGDMSLAKQRTVPPSTILQEEADYAVIETTLASRQEVSSEKVETRLLRDVEGCLGRGGKFIFARRSIGPAQEIFAILKQGGILERWPKCVFFDGATRSVAEVYARHSAFGEEIKDVSPYLVSTEEQRKEIISSSRPAVVIAPADQRSEILLRYLSAWSRSSRNVVDVAARGVRFRAKTTTYVLRAHLSLQDLEAIVGRLDPKKVFLVHGDTDESKKIERFLGRTVTRTVLGKSYYL